MTNERKVILSALLILAALFGFALVLRHRVNAHGSEIRQTDPHRVILHPVDTAGRTRMDLPAETVYLSPVPR